MALSSQSVHSSNPENTAVKPHNKIDIHGVLRTSCNNCTECPQFIGIPGHVLCAYCGCPPARHGKGVTACDGASRIQSSSVDRIKGRVRHVSADSVGRGRGTGTDSELDSDHDSYGDSESEETSSGVSSFTSNRGPRRQRRRWRPINQVTVPPPRVVRLLESEPVSREEQVEHSWNELDSSPNIYVKTDDPFTFHRNPVYQTSDAIRGKAGSDGEGYTRGLHIWSIYWPSDSWGTHPVVGVATRECHLTEPGYKRLVGSTSSSWGWCLNTKKVYHDSRKFRYGVEYPRDIGEKLRVPETFYMILDMDRGTLAFQVHNDFLGVAFSGLRGEELFPIASAVWGHCEVTLSYIGSHVFDHGSSLS